MKSEKVTASDVARAVGVSRSAVSRVFTPGASVSKETAARVREMAEILGYRPNVMARSLITGRSRIIGLVVAYLENHFYPEVLEKLSRALQAKGYHVLIFMSSQTAENADDVIEQILDYQVAGIVMASVSLSSALTTQCAALGVPLVMVNRTQDVEGVASVTSDNVAGGYLVGRFLAAGGHTRIAYIAGWEGASTQRDREAGFLAALADAGVTLFSRAVGAFDSATAALATQRMFAGLGEVPDAVFVANDHMAFAVMDVLRHDLGLRVPEDVSVVGYDDVPPAAWSSYGLTTVRQDGDAMVARTVDILLSQIATPLQRATPHCERLPAPLVLRRSARIPQGWSDGAGGMP